MHSNAAGISIKNSNVDKLIKYANEKLIDVNFNSNIYEVDFIFNHTEDLFDFVFEIDNISTTFGQANAEPLITIEDIPLHKGNIEIMGANKDTIKFHTNGITVIMFKAKDFLDSLTKESDNFKLTIIGRVNVNEYCGNQTPQLLVNQWKFRQPSIFDF